MSNHTEAIERALEKVGIETLRQVPGGYDGMRNYLLPILRELVEAVQFDAGAAHGYAQGCEDTHKEWLEQEAVNALMLAKVQEWAGANEAEPEYGTLPSGTLYECRAHREWRVRTEARETVLAVLAILTRAKEPSHE